MVAVRNLLSSLNNLAQSGLLASGWPIRASHGVRRRSGAGGMPEPDGRASTSEAGVEPPLEEVLDDPRHRT